ncbi:conjugal transfer protein TraH [Mesorhizobium tianshanense]|uniref:TraH protein n=1 Tax=Mesorhizobium tianshanense TaxID=39844 RepID=A0A562NLQ5_9HYPH|nr:TraH family protein [Mesorhizobium tianshanense]TWI33139.1 TraH protein [Mesorhizobium tianshanense]GLS34989.1 conjugal transfer protein TraH [Mesorhizobium tianshanense]
MIDAALIQQCADPRLRPAIVEKFIATVGSDNPLGVSITSGNRMILAPPATTPEEAMALVRRYVGQAVVRVGVTQYPAGLGIKDVSELKPDLVDACANIGLGTALFGKVYRIVAKWYGAPADEAFEDAIVAWRSGTFEGRSVFTEPDPGDVHIATPKPDEPSTQKEDGRAAELEDAPEEGLPDPPLSDEDPNKAGIRIDLSGIGAATED